MGGKAGPSSFRESLRARVQEQSDQGWGRCEGKSARGKWAFRSACTSGLCAANVVKVAAFVVKVKNGQLQKRGGGGSKWAELRSMPRTPLWLPLRTLLSSGLVQGVHAAVGRPKIMADTRGGSCPHVVCGRNRAGTVSETFQNCFRTVLEPFRDLRPFRMGPERAQNGSQR